MASSTYASKRTSKLTSGTNILDRPIGKSQGLKQVGLSSFAFLFSEMIQYAQDRVNDIAHLESKLAEMGYQVGWRVLDLIVLRERPLKRDIKQVAILQFISSKCWKFLFGKPTDALERSTESESVFYVYEDKPVTSRYLSLPRELEGKLNCASFNAGIIQGILEAANFQADVRAVEVKKANAQTPLTRTVYVITFS